MISVGEINSVDDQDYPASPMMRGVSHSIAAVPIMYAPTCRAGAGGILTSAVAAASTQIAATTKISCPASTPNVEGQEAEWDVGLRQAYFLKRAGEAEAVQQPEGKRHDPGVAFGKSPLAGFSLDELAGDESDTERDGRFYRSLR